MARATATWTNTETTDFDAGDFLRATKLLEQVLQNIEHLAQNHDHGGGSGDGAVLATADPKAIWFYAGAASS